MSGLKYQTYRLYIEEVHQHMGTGRYQGLQPTWAFYQKFDFGPAIALGNAAAGVEPDGKLSYKLTAESSRVHGGSGRFPIPGSDVKAVFVHMTTELVLDDPKGVDDRSSAQLLLSTGADYYPNMTTKVADYSPMTYAPNVAGSRHGLVSATPRIHYSRPLTRQGRKKIYQYTKKMAEFQPFRGRV